MPLFKFLTFIVSYTGNWGWSIIILTILIKILFYPLTKKSFNSMKRMKELTPQLKIIQERYKDDRQKLSEEMMSLYRTNKVNPMGGCLPMILQIPVFIALYNVLLVSIEIKGAPFILWIHDLSVADPYYIYPVLMGISMFVQQKISPPMGDPLQQKIMMFLPLIFTFLFMNFPAGLVIYWVVNNVLTISQQWYIYQQVDTTPKEYKFKEEKPKEISAEKSSETATEPTKKKKQEKKKGPRKKRK
ncbi:MAG: membrane protein insertase YidC [Nitrospinae bacterium]|nr:membrane protein insertase YidC [Nitrospinota bacterium]